MKDKWLKKVVKKISFLGVFLMFPSLGFAFNWPGWPGSSNNVCETQEGHSSIVILIHNNTKETLTVHNVFPTIAGADAVMTTQMLRDFPFEAPIPPGTLFLFPLLNTIKPGQYGMVGLCGDSWEHSEHGDQISSFVQVDQYYLGVDNPSLDAGWNSPMSQYLGASGVATPFLLTSLAKESPGYHCLSYLRSDHSTYTFLAFGNPKLKKGIRITDVAIGGCGCHTGSAFDNTEYNGCNGQATFEVDQGSDMADVPFAN